ncbi:hypothetical protein [Bartonella sp. ML69XJBT]|uniref:hypothetical protein n=1 Tax=Bartonella sp. ML69XJBT TaxID=3019092 RepID=UPI0023603D7A|nr:hypothetical protein [Bartonella sp. ML69XJBT]
MGDHNTFIVIVGIIIAASIIYSLWLANHREKLLQLKYRECAIYQNILAQGEQRLFQKTRRIPKEWIRQWDEGVRQWERSILEIKNPGHFSQMSEQQHPMVVKDICAQGYADTFFLYKQALKVEFTVEQIERVNEVMRRPLFKKNYRKVVRLMKQNGIKLRKFVDPLTKKKRYKPTMLLFHWWLYMIDDMITAEYEQQQKDKASGCYDDLASRGIYYQDLPKYTEYETLEKILPYWYHMLGDSEMLYVCKKGLLSLLYDISSDYKAARETFIYYKMLIDTVKEGYIAFDKGCFYSTVEWAIQVYRKRDKEEKKGLSISEEMPTFEEAYKLGAEAWMRSSNETCDNRMIFWEMLITIENSKKKLKIIFGDKKVQALQAAIDKEKKRFKNEIQSAILANKYLNYDQSCEHFISYLK